MKTDHINQRVGTIEIITFSTTRDDSALGYPVNGLVSGLSTGHIALRLTFSDKELFDHYIRHNAKIPHQMLIDPVTKRKMYEVYMSFWPNTIGLPWSNSSALQSHKFDCEHSGNYTDMEYNPRFEYYLKPLTKIAAPNIPIGQDLLYSTVTLPPTIILHTTRLQSSLSKSFAPEQQQEIIYAAELFCQRYHAWRMEIINRQNAEFETTDDIKQLAPYTRSENIAKARAKISERKFKHLLYPDEKLNQDEFVKKLEPFVTFGYPERDIVQLPLISKYEASKGINSTTSLYGLELKPMLATIHHIANNPEQYPYNVLDTNCAKVALEIILSGCTDAIPESAKAELELPWYVRWFGVSLTPTMILQQISKLQNILEIKNRNAECTLENETGYPDLTTNVPYNHKRRIHIQPHEKIMQFYHHDEDTDTHSAILGKIAESVNQLHHL